ncbi:MAG: PAS domain S-box protein [Thermoanaerobaculia bacterium]|nr:PAS domain S-box protein [Thermoanaerobaculia bacterium]
MRHLPNLERHLRWLIAFRLVMISSVLLSYLVFELSSRGELPEFNLLFVLVAATYVASILHIALLRLLATRPLWHAYIQFAGDLALVSGLVYFFGGITSPFSMLYLVVIMVAAVILQRRAALTIAGLAYILYAILLTALARNWIPALSPLPTDLELSYRISYNLAVHLFGFYAVALLTSYLGESASRAEEELAEKSGSLANLEIFHRDVIQSISSGLISTDLDARVTSVNRAALEILATTETALLGRPIAASGLFSEAEWAAAASDRSADRLTRSELVVERGAERLPIGFTVTRLTDANNVPTGWIVVFQDLSQWRRLQEELRLKDRMAAVGELAAGLAHEVGNPLAAISGSVQLLSVSIAAGQQERRLLDIIVKESLRLDRTIKGFLRFARPRERAAARFDIAALLAENTALLRNSEEATGGHEFSLELEPESVQLAGDPDQISQIFWNLARNALRAMPKGGKLLILGRLRGESYSIEFRDTGHGMSEEQRAKLFHPFQSFFDSGTGIGMAIVYRIVQEHGGSISVESRPAEGTRIVVSLPLHHEAALPVASEA